MRFGISPHLLPARLDRLAAPARRAWDVGLDLVFPPTCASCDAQLLDAAGRVMLCALCREQLIGRGPICLRCGLAVPPEWPSAEDCPICRKAKWRIDGLVRLGGYEAALRTCVLRTKRAHEQPLAAALADMFVHVRGSELEALGADVVVPIPMHWSRRMWRGASSPESLGQRLAQFLRVPCASFLLRRVRRTRPQAELSPTARLRNVRGAFHAERQADLPGARVLLVDDVLTTGATLNEAARVLKRAKAASVVAAVFARAEHS